MPSTQTSTLKPGGTLSLSVGNSFAALPVRCGASGCSGEFACSAERPCCHDGGGAVAAPGGARAGDDPCTCEASGPLVGAVAAAGGAGGGGGGGGGAGW